MSGKVYLVGAGPGDPELLTLKAARVLRNADAVLHDDLVGEAILTLVPAHAQVRNIGKRCGKKNISQEEINFLMITLAASGLQVVRLKGGDPVIFGRIREEITALRAAHIEFEIVPGITAALGAAASTQMPLTDRRFSHSLVFLTGQSASGDDPTNWCALVSLGATLVIYMPGHRYAEISVKLRSAGLSGQAPCAIISRATTPEEKSFTSTIEALGDAPLLPAPTLLIVGEVLRHTAPGSSPEQAKAWNGWLPKQYVSRAPTQADLSCEIDLGYEEQAK